MGGSGFKHQFTTLSNLYYGYAGIVTSLYAFKSDERITDRYGGSEIPNLIDHIGDAGVLLSFPIIPGAFYFYGRNKNQPHKIQFAKEYFAAMYLSLIEVAALSHIKIHSRPSKQNLSFWDTEFRGPSSWPSGHVIPYTTLMFKTLQFYGPLWATIPAALSVAASIQRIKDRKHYLSDVVGALFISAMASEGVRSAANYQNNHPLYKAIFERNIRVGIRYYREVPYPWVGWSF